MSDRKVRPVFGLFVVLAVVLALASAGCGSGDEKPSAPAKGASTGTPEPSSAVVTTSGVATTAPGEVPAKVKEFAAKSEWPVWYPTKVPSAYTLQEVDTLELEPGTGLVNDVYWATNEREIDLLQGSPKTREYVIESVGKVPWGNETADVVYEDPEDTSSPKMIIYHAKGTLAELAGGKDFEELKAVAASMVAVQ